MLEKQGPFKDFDELEEVLYELNELMVDNPEAVIVVKVDYEHGYEELWLYRKGEFKIVKDNYSSFDYYQEEPQWWSLAPESFITDCIPESIKSITGIL